MGCRSREGVQDTVSENTIWGLEFKKGNYELTLMKLKKKKIIIEINNMNK